MIQRVIDIVGTGLGPASLTRAAAESVAAAEVLLGSPRLLAEHAGLGQRSIAATRPVQIIELLDAMDATDADAVSDPPSPAATPSEVVSAAAAPSENIPESAERITILMSGDVGFHSGARSVYEALKSRPGYTVRLVPGVPTPVLFAARIGTSWEDAALVSCHGNDTDLVAAVRRHPWTFALTGNNIPALADGLITAGFGGLEAWVGENLGLPDERVTPTRVDALPGGQWSSLSALAIANSGWDARVRTGIPDREFVRGEIPMTKQGIRAYALSRLALNPDDVCWDIGCGTGSVSVEMALSAWNGQVWAVDKKAEALDLTRRNCQAFQVGNVRVKAGSAPEALTDWPKPDAVFIGGTSGNLEPIIAKVTARNPAARVVVTAIAVESVAAALKAAADIGQEPEIAQLSLAYGRKAGELHLLTAQNPVTVISWGDNV